MIASHQKVAQKRQRQHKKLQGRIEGLKICDKNEEDN